MEINQTPAATVFFSLKNETFGSYYDASFKTKSSPSVCVFMWDESDGWAILFLSEKTIWCFCMFLIELKYMHLVSQ